MTLDYALGGFVTLFILAYLVYALVRNGVANSLLVDPEPNPVIACASQNDR